MFKRLPVFGLVLLSLGLALPARAGPPARLDLEYHLYGLGIHAVTIRLRYNRSGDGYRARLVALTDGIVRTFYEYDLRANVQGTRHGAALRPLRYVAASRESDDGDRVTINYAADGEIAIEKEKPIAADEMAARLTRGRETVDPLSAMLTLIESVAANGSCDSAVRVFDGKRRYDMTAADTGADGGAAAAPTDRPGEIECHVTLTQLAGFRAREKDSPRYPKTMTIRLGPVAEGFPPMPVEITGSNFFGLVSLRLVDATPSPGS